MSVVSSLPDEPTLRSILEQWFRGRLADESVRLVAFGPLSGGLSNETRLASVQMQGELVRYVVRWDPVEGIMAPYDIGKQFRVMQALSGTRVKAPRTCWLETDPSVLGRDFSAVEYVSGETPGRLLDRSDPRSRARLQAYVNMLAEIHRVDWQAAGLDRILAPQTRPAEAAVTGADRFLEHVRDRDFFDRARERLLRNAPRSRRISLTHGDCSLSNYLFSGDCVAAVVDWEMAALGDALQDVGFYCALVARYRIDASPADKEAERQDFLRRYAQAAGADVSDAPYWEAVSCYRNAVFSSQPAYAAYATTHYRERLAELLSDQRLMM